VANEHLIIIGIALPLVKSASSNKQHTNDNLVQSQNSLINSKINTHFENRNYKIQITATTTIKTGVYKTDHIPLIIQLLTTISTLS